MNTPDQIKWIKKYLHEREADAQKSDNTSLNKEDYRERCQTIRSIGLTMNDVVKYCYEDGWDQDAVCHLIFKVCFGEIWPKGYGWPSP